MDPLVVVMSWSVGRPGAVDELFSRNFTRNTRKVK
jgi:hypothetical protein